MPRYEYGNAAGEKPKSAVFLFQAASRRLYTMRPLPGHGRSKAFHNNSDKQFLHGAVKIIPAVFMAEFLKQGTSKKAAIFAAFFLYNFMCG